MGILGAIGRTLRIHRGTGTQVPAQVRAILVEIAQQLDGLRARDIEHTTDSIYVFIDLRARDRPDLDLSVTAEGQVMIRLSA
jgi:hypothetical protein